MFFHCFFCQYTIVAGELDMDDIQLRKIYRGHAKIKESFKITKICLKSLKSYNCIHLDSNIWQFTFYDEILY